MNVKYINLSVFLFCCIDICLYICKRKQITNKYLSI